MVQNGRVTQYDDREQPSPSGDETAPDSDSGAWDDTRPISQPETEASAAQDDPTVPVAPAPSEEPRPEDTRVWPAPGAGHDAGYMPVYEQQSYGREPEPRGPDSRPAGQPGWFWPVVTAVALVVGLLGGTLASVAVFRSLGGTGTVNVDFAAGRAWTRLTNRIHPTRHFDSGIIALRRAVGDGVNSA